MNEKLLNRLLSNLAEQMAPDDVDLWPAIRVRFAASNKHSLKGDFSMKTNNTPNRRLRLAAVSVLTLAIMLLLLFVTPQGRALAQEILHFFTRAESDTLPVQSWQLTPLPTADPNIPDPASIIDASQSVQAIEAQVAFDVLEPTWLPEILTFSGASIEPEGSVVRIFYSYVETNGLVLRQEPIQQTQDCEFLCDDVGASAAVETVQIGDEQGEYVEGVWNLTDKGPVWESNPWLKTMRWQSNGMAFELMYMGPPDTLSKADMIAIAESLK